MATPAYFNHNMDAARKYDVPFWLLMGVYGIETTFGQNVRTSSAGAMGPYQFMPATAAQYGYPMTNTPTEAQFVQQVNAAAKYLSDLHRQYGDWDTAIRHYSGGGYGLSDVQRKAGPLKDQYNDDNTPNNTGNRIRQAVNSTVDSAKAIPMFLGRLSVIFEGKFWLRAFLVLGGAALLGFGVMGLFKQYTGVIPIPV